MKTRAKKRRTPSSRAGKPRASKSVKPKAVARPTTTPASSQTAIKKLARRWFDELWNKRNVAALFELMDPHAVGDTEGGSVSGHDDFIQKLHSPLIGAFPDLVVTVDDVIAEGNKAAVRWTLQATHSGDTLGIPATNRRVSISGMTWIHYKNGKVIAGWDRWNANGLIAYLRDGTPCATVRLPA